MNKYNMELPEYKAFHQIKIGSNTLTDTMHLFNISGYYPIVIGKGDLMPRVWLYALVRGEIRSVVNNNNSDVLSVQFEYDESSRQLSYTFVNQVSNERVCILRLESDRDECDITQLDLRPFGLIIYLDGDTLNVGTIKLRDNHFTGDTFISVK